MTENNIVENLKFRKWGRGVYSVYFRRWDTISKMYKTESLGNVEKIGNVWLAFYDDEFKVTGKTRKEVALELYNFHNGEVIR